MFVILFFSHSLIPLHSTSKQQELEKDNLNELDKMLTNWKIRQVTKLNWNH